jgi:hypothetical protein
MDLDLWNETRFWLQTQFRIQQVDNYFVVFKKNYMTLNPKKP